MKKSKKSGFKNKLYDSLILVDAFGIPNRLYNKGKEKYKTSVGGCITLVTVVIVLLLCIPEIVTILTYDSYTFSASNEYLNQPGFMNLNADNFPIAISIDDSKHTFDNAMVGIEVFYANYTRDEEGEQSRDKTSIELIPCTKEYFKGYETFFDNNNIENALCPNLEEYRIGGAFLRDLFLFIEIEFAECDPATHSGNSITCASEEDIEEYWEENEVNAQVFFPISSIDSTNRENPVSYVITNMYKTLSRGLEQSMDLYLDEVTMKSYDFPFSSSRFINFDHVTYNGYKEEQVLLKDSDKYWEMYFRKSFTRINYERRYANVAILFSYIGGIFALVLRVAGFLGEEFNRIIYEKSIADDIYSFENPKYAQKNKKKPEEKKDEHKDEQKDQKQLDLEAKQEKKDEMFYVKKTIMGDSRVFKDFWQYLWVSIKCGKKTDEEKMRVKQQNKALKYSQEKLDIINIVHKLQELEKLKNLLLDSRNLSLFNYLPKPIIPVPEIEEEKEDDADDKNKDNSDKDKKKKKKNKKKKKGPKERMPFSKGAIQNFASKDSIQKLYRLYLEVKVRKGLLGDKLIQMLGPKTLVLFRLMDQQRLLRLGGIQKLLKVKPVLKQKVYDRLAGKSDGIPPMPEGLLDAAQINPKIRNSSRNEGTIVEQLFAQPLPLLMQGSGDSPTKKKQGSDEHDIQENEDDYPKQPGQKDKIKASNAEQGENENQGQMISPKLETKENKDNFDLSGSKE